MKLAVISLNARKHFNLLSQEDLDPERPASQFPSTVRILRVECDLWA